MLEMIRVGMSSIPHFKPIFASISNLQWLSSNHSIKLDWCITICTFKMYFSVVVYVIYLAVFSGKPPCQINILNDQIVVD